MAISPVHSVWSRRGFGRLIAQLSAVGCSCGWAGTGMAAPAAVQASGSARAEEATPRPSSARRILVIGDSFIAGAFGRFVVEGLGDTHGHVTQRVGHTASGLARRDFFDWFAESRRQLEEFRPDTTVVMFGGNDGQSIRMPRGSHARGSHARGSHARGSHARGSHARGSHDRWIRWGETRAWNAEYRRRIRSFADILAPASSSRRLVWLGMPVMGRPELHRRVQHINRVFRGEMALRSNAAFLDIWPVLANAEGGYARYLRVDGRKLAVRARDGVHFTRAGSRRVAKYVTHRIHGAATANAGPRPGLMALL